MDINFALVIFNGGHVTTSCETPPPLGLASWHHGECDHCVWKNLPSNRWLAESDHFFSIESGWRTVVSLGVSFLSPLCSSHSWPNAATFFPAVVVESLDHNIRTRKSHESFIHLAGGFKYHKNHRLFWEDFHSDCYFHQAWKPSTRHHILAVFRPRLWRFWDVSKTPRWPVRDNELSRSFRILYICWNRTLTDT